METSLNWYCSDCEAHFDHCQSESQVKGSVFLDTVRGGTVFTCFTNCHSELHFPAFPGACTGPLPFHRAFCLCLVDEGLESKCMFLATIACISGQEHFSRTWDYYLSLPP